MIRPKEANLEISQTLFHAWSFANNVAMAIVTSINQLSSTAADVVIIVDERMSDESKFQKAFSWWNRKDSKVMKHCWSFWKFTEDCSRECLCLLWWKNGKDLDHVSKVDFRTLDCRNWMILDHISCSNKSSQDKYSLETQSATFDLYLSPQPFHSFLIGNRDPFVLGVLSFLWSSLRLSVRFENVPKAIVFCLPVAQPFETNISACCDCFQVQQTRISKWISCSCRMILDPSIIFSSVQEEWYLFRFELVLFCQCKKSMKYPKMINIQVQPLRQCTSEAESRNYMQIFNFFKMLQIDTFLVPPKGEWRTATTETALSSNNLLSNLQESSQIHFQNLSRWEWFAFSNCLILQNRRCFLQEEFINLRKNLPLKTIFVFQSRVESSLCIQTTRVQQKVE